MTWPSCSLRRAATRPPSSPASHWSLVDATVGTAAPGFSPGSVPVVVVGVVDGDDVDVAGVDPAPYDVLLGADDPMLAALVEQVARFPVAAASLAVLLRASERRSIEDGLAAESAVYSTLQAGPEFAAWRRSRGDGGLPPDLEPPVLVDRVGDELHVTLNRPRRHNAVTAALRDGLAEALTLAAADDTIAAVHLAGNGPSFCSGGDLAEFGSFPDPATAHVDAPDAQPGPPRPPDRRPAARAPPRRVHGRRHRGAGPGPPRRRRAGHRDRPARAGARARARGRRDGEHARSASAATAPRRWR